MVVGSSLVRIVTVLKCLNKNIEDFEDIYKYLSYENQTRLSAEQIASLMVEELNNLLICEVPVVVEEECHKKLMEITERLKRNDRQKAIFVISEKTTLELGENFSGAVMRIDERERDVQMSIHPNVKNDLYLALSTTDMNKVTQLLAESVDVNSFIQILLECLFIRDNDGQQLINLYIKILLYFVIF